MDLMHRLEEDSDGLLVRRVTLSGQASTRTLNTVTEESLYRLS